MSVRVMTAVWDNGPKNYIDRYVLLCIADSANDEGHGYPSVTTIMAKTQLGKRTVSRSIQNLEDAGWLFVRRKSRKIRFSTYDIQLDRFKKSDASQAPVKKGESSASRDTSQVPIGPESGAYQSQVPHTPYIEEPPLNHKYQPPKKTAWDLQGERCFMAYPKKTSPKAGIAAFTGLIGALIRAKRFGSAVAAGDWLIGRVVEYAASPCVRSQNLRFVPRASRWVEEGKYDEDPALWLMAATPSGSANFNDERAQMARIIH